MRVVKLSFISTLTTQQNTWINKLVCHRIIYITFAIVADNPG